MFWRSKAGWQAGLILFCGLVAFVLAHSYDFYEQLHNYMEEHEDYQFDELIVAFVIVGFMSMIYAGLRYWDFRSAQKQRDHAEARSDWMAQHDALTKLLNRHALSAHLAEATSSSTPFHIILADLDGFKKVNDVFGHKVGDLVLEVVSERLKERVSPGSLYRYGGDEFVAIISQEAEETAARLLEAFSAPIMFNGVELDIGASIGVASYPADGARADDCLTCADAAMYHAKASGRGTVCVYDPTMQERQLLKAQLERDLREAVRGDVITPFYQPIIDLQSGTVVGFEALARWETAPGQFMPPSEFIPLAEEIGLIGQLSDRLLLKALCDAATWPDEILLSFNISPAQLGEPTLGLRILKALLEVGLPPHRLEIEITETALVRDLETAARILNDLHQGGIRIALDDFGTGYSSLAQLSNFRFDKIKIDRSFVASFQDKAKQEKLVRAIVGLGMGLDVSTTAEGIETEGQMSSLREMGCTYGQGYLFGKAVPSDQAIAFLKAAGGGTNGIRRA